jgi:hypothetical protein
MGALATRLSQYQAWAVTTPDQLQRPLAQAVPAAREVEELLRAGNGVAVWATVQNGNLDVRFGVQCSSDESAQQAVAKLQTAMPHLFGALESMAASKATVRALIAELRTSAKAAASGPVAETSALVPVASVEAALPELEALASGRD